MYKHIKADLVFASVTGGTDINGCFALGCPIAPVYDEQLQCRGLGVAMSVWNDNGEEVVFPVSLSLPFYLLLPRSLSISLSPPSLFPLPSPPRYAGSPFALFSLARSPPSLDLSLLSFHQCTPPLHQ